MGSAPTAGQNYTVRSGDTLRVIARQAYGNDRSTLIVRSNSRLLAGRDVSREGLPFIFPGDILEIPALNVPGAPPITADFDTEVTAVVAGRELRGVVASHIERALNSIADGFVFSAPFDYRDRELVDAFRPFGYQGVTLYIGGAAYITGRIMRPSFKIENDGLVVTSEARTIPGDMIECTGANESIERGGRRLLQIAEEVAQSYGLRAFSTHGNSDVIPHAVQEVTENDFTFLSRLASQCGFLLTTSNDGNLLFTRAAVNEAPVAALRVGEYPVLSAEASYDATKRHSTWFGYAEVAGLPPARATLRDTAVRVHRPFAFSADESTSATIADAVRWRMAKSVADSVAITVTVAGWRIPGGELWRENVKVTLWAPHVCIFSETPMIVASVNLTKGEDGGDQAVLMLVPPGAYTLDMPKSYPWDGYAEG